MIKLDRLFYIVDWDEKPVKDATGKMLVGHSVREALLKLDASYDYSMRVLRPEIADDFTEALMDDDPYRTDDALMMLYESSPYEVYSGATHRTASHHDISAELA